MNSEITQLLDFKQLSHFKLEDRPYQWGIIKNVFRKKYASILSQEFPTVGFLPCEANRDDKSIQNAHTISKL